MAPHLFIPSITLLLLGVALRVSLRLLYGARGPAPDDGVYLFMRTVSWALIILPTIIFLVGTTHWVSLLLFVAIYEAVVELVVARRQARRESAWRLLLMAVAGGQPLAESLRYHQGRFSGIIGRWYRRLIRDLDKGAPLVEAVWANRPALPREAPVYTALLASSGATRTVAARINESEDDPVLDVRQHIYQRFAYLATIALITVGVMSFVMIKIVPSFAEIFADFDLTLPTITLAFISLAEVFGPVLAAPIVLAYFVIITGGVLVGFLYLIDVPALQPVFDFVGFSQHRARVLRLLATSIEQGAPLDMALVRLQDRRYGYPSRLVRARLGGASDRIEAGHEWTEAMRRSKLISGADAALLQTAQQVGNLPWAMRMLAERKLRLMSFRWSVMENIGFSAIIFLIGMFVAWYAVAMFVPLVDLVNNMSG
jgi:type IV pilus assembly protein PilC